MLNRVKGLLYQGKGNTPEHIAITTSGTLKWSEKEKKTIEEANTKSILRLKEVMKKQVELNIKTVTFYLLREEMDKSGEHFGALIDSLVVFLEELKEDAILDQNKIKIAVIGKWYNLPSRIVDPIKALLEKTFNNDKFYVNFLLNYDGQKEIVDACKLIGRQIKAEKLDPDLITTKTIKQNLSSSNFPPPDIIVKNGTKKATRGMLLWDSQEAKIVFTDLLWPDFSGKDFERIAKI